MFRFSIRELMLVTLVVGLSLGWAIDHWRPNNPYLSTMCKNQAMEEKLKIEGYVVVQDGWRVDIVNKAHPEKNFFMGILGP